MQIPEHHRNKNKESRSDSIQRSENPRSVRTKKNPMNTISELKESWCVKEASTPQCMTSVAGHPKNRFHIDSGASLHILINKELMGGIFYT